MYSAQTLVWFYCLHTTSGRSAPSCTRFASQALSWGMWIAPQDQWCTLHRLYTLLSDLLLCADSCKATVSLRWSYSEMNDQNFQKSRTGLFHPNQGRRSLCQGHRECVRALFPSRSLWDRIGRSLHQYTHDEARCARTNHCPWTPSIWKSIARSSDHAQISSLSISHRRKQFWNYDHEGSIDFQMQCPLFQSTLKSSGQSPLIDGTFWTRHISELQCLKSM